MYLCPMYLRSLERAFLKSSAVFSSINASPLGRPSLEYVKHTPFTFPTILQSKIKGKKQSRMYFLWSWIHDAHYPCWCGSVSLQCADSYQRRNWPPPPGCRTRAALWSEPRNPHRFGTSLLPPRAQHSSHTVSLKHTHAEQARLWLCSPHRVYSHSCTRS